MKAFYFTLKNGDFLTRERIIFNATYENQIWFVLWKTVFPQLLSSGDSPNQI